jgi:hypothetical protein
MSARVDRSQSAFAWLAGPLAVALIAGAWLLGRNNLLVDLLAPIHHGSRVGLATVDGAWLSNIVVWAVDWLPGPLPVQLTAFSACVIGGLLAWLYRRLLFNGWPVAEALLLVLALAAHAVIVGAVIANHRAIPVILACAAVVPAIRRLESVGDVQAEMSFGLVLPLLFLAGPTMTLLVPVLALFGAASDPNVRTDPRALAAMFIVSIMPTVLIMVGLFGMLGGTEASRLFTDVYAARFHLYRLDPEAVRPLLAMTATAVLPFALVIAAYLLHRDRRRQPWSALAVLGLPAYLVAGTLIFHWPILASTPTAVFLGAVASWLSVARLTPTVRRVAIALMVLGAAISWTAPMLGDYFRNVDQSAGTVATSPSS